MDLERQAKRRKFSKNGHGKRFYTQLDMAIIKKDQATRNAQIKRGEIEDKPNNGIFVCGCGREGCFIHIGRENINYDDYRKKFK